MHFDDDDFYGEEYVAQRIADIKVHLSYRGLTADAPLIVPLGARTFRLFSRW